jgi:hypothetical protein
MKICIDIDDFHTFPPWDCTDAIEEILVRYPQAKFTLFATPRMKGTSLSEKPVAVDRVRNLMRRGSVELFAHGLTHRKILNGEFGFLPELLAGARIDRAFALFREAGVECGRGFKFPWNVYGRGALRALEKRGLMLFTNKIEPEYAGIQVAWMEHGNIRRRRIQTGAYRYGKPATPGAGDILYYHGHAQAVRSTGLGESCDNLMRELEELSSHAELEFVFCSDASIFSEFRVGNHS